VKTQIPFGEAWLLETLSLYCAPLWCLTREEREMKDWLNRGHHRLGFQDLKETLLRMFQAGDIQAFAKGDDSGFMPTERQLDDALGKKDKETYCGVTEQGGTRWEGLACPNWNRYFQDCDWNTAEHSVEVTAGSRERLTEIVAGSKILWHNTMDASSLNIETLRPWQAVHWKTLEVGYQAIVRYSDLPYDFHSRDEYIASRLQDRERYLELRSWATSICGFALV
jgi:hypothetical protein